MSTTLNTDQLFRELDTIKEGQTSGFSGVHKRLDTLNGRTGSLETRMTIVWWALGTMCAIVMALTPTAVKYVISLIFKP